jgi:hypothetical protein
MNGPQFVEAARVLAERLLAEHDGRAEPALDRAFEVLTNRPPDDKERRIIRRMHTAQLDWYRSRPEDAAKLVAVGDKKPLATLPAAELAATASVVNALMNYDGSVVKR